MECGNCGFKGVGQYRKHDWAFWLCPTCYARKLLVSELIKKFKSEGYRVSEVGDGCPLIYDGEKLFGKIREDASVTTFYRGITAPLNIEFYDE